MRTDIHRPSAIVPADYTYVVSYALATVVDGWPVPPYNVDMVVRLREEGKLFAQTGGLGKCSVCGACFLYGDVWRHEPTGEHIHIGHECADKYELLVDRTEFELAHDRLKSQSAREACRVRNAQERAEFLNANPGLEEALATDHPIVKDIAEKFREYRSLSEKQIALVHKLATETKEPAKAEEKLVKAPEGKVTFKGVVVSTKWYESQFGSVVKATVKVTTPDGVWLAWGTCPAAILESMPCAPNGRMENLRGKTVEITATLKPGRDAHFAIMSRPRGRCL